MPKTTYLFRLLPALAMFAGGCTIYTQPARVHTAANVNARATVQTNTPTYVTVGEAPPPIHEAVVRPQRPHPNAVWVAGYWDWQGQWVWRTGQWQVPQQGQVWEAPVTVAVEGGGYQYHPGYWHEGGQAPPPIYRTPGTIRVTNDPNPVVQRVTIRPGQPTQGTVTVRPGRPSAPSSTVVVRPSGNATVTTRPNGNATVTTTTRPNGNATVTTRPSGNATVRPATPTTTVRPSGGTVTVRPTTPTPTVRPSGGTVAVRPTRPNTTVRPSGGTTTVRPTTPTVRPSGGTTTVRPTTPTVRPSGGTVAVRPTRPNTTVRPSGGTTTVRPTTPTVRPSGGTVAVRPTRPNTTVRPSGGTTTVRPTTPTVRPSGGATTVRPTRPNTTVRPSGGTVAVRPTTPTVRPSGGGTTTVRPTATSCRPAARVVPTGGVLVLRGSGLAAVESVQVGTSQAVILSQTGTQVRARVDARPGSGRVVARVNGRSITCGSVNVIATPPR